MTTLKLLDYSLNFITYEDILELIKKDILQKGKFCQIISLNPENLLLMKQNPQFEKLVVSSQTLIPDGVGMVVAAKLLAGVTLRRLPGVELMDRLLRHSAQHRLRCLLIGGSANFAELTQNCYQKKNPELTNKGFQAISSIKKPNQTEMAALKRIVSLIKPHLVFVAFGSPAQELWIEKNKYLFKGCLVIGVGGGFAMLSGVLPRAPRFLQYLGLEWLYRLFQEPWRIRRQTKLLSFIFLMLKDKFRNK